MAPKTEKRRREILNIINMDGTAYVNELSRMFNVTSETIRTDFDYLAEEYELERIHGGIKKDKPAVYNHSYKYHESMLRNVEEKKRICYKASDLIDDGNLIFLDGGSTTSYLLNFMHDKENITLVTPSVAILLKYMMESFDDSFKQNKNKLIFTGGDIDARIHTGYGPFFEKVVEDLYFDKVFLSIDAIDIKGGCTDSDEVSYSIIRRVSMQSQSNIVLADNSKFDYVSGYKALGWGDVDFLVTDTDLNDEWISHLQKVKVEYIKA